MAPLVDLDWLSILLITGMVVPTLGATIFGLGILRRRSSLPASPNMARTPVREAS